MMSMEAQTQRQGRITIAPDVLVAIAMLTTLGVPGVARMSPAPDVMDRWFQRGANEGVHIEVKGQTVTVDLYIVVTHDARVREVSRTIQAGVARAIEEMVGMAVLRVNVHIEDVAFPGIPANSQ